MDKSKIAMAVDKLAELEELHRQSGETIKKLKTVLALQMLHGASLTGKKVSHCWLEGGTFKPPTLLMKVDGEGYEYKYEEVPAALQESAPKFYKIR